MKKAPLVIILLGPVGAGKSTVGRLIEKKMEGCFLSIEEFFIERFSSYENYAANRDLAYSEFEKEIISSVNNGKAPVIFEEVALSHHGKKLVETIIQEMQAEHKTQMRGIQIIEANKHY